MLVNSLRVPQLFKHSHLFKNCANIFYARLSRNISFTKTLNTNDENVVNPSGPTTIPMDDKTAKNIKLFQLEMATFLSTRLGNYDYTVLNPRQEDWHELMTLKSVTARKRLYRRLFRKLKDNELNKKRLKDDERAFEKQSSKRKKQEKSAQNKHIRYGLGHTSLILRIRPQLIDQMRNYKLALAKLYSPSIIIECSNDSQMSSEAANRSATQISTAFRTNKNYYNPLDLHLCNANSGQHTMRCLQKQIPNLLQPAFPMDVHEKSAIDIFPIEKLVYLTPHCGNDLEIFSDDDIYVIGAYGDAHRVDSATLAMTNKLRIRTARLPLDRYFKWKCGVSSLTFDQMINIMLELRETGEWSKALRFVSRRSLIMKTDEK